MNIKYFDMSWLRGVLVVFFLLGCTVNAEEVIVGAKHTSEYFPILKGQRIAVFSNHTGMVDNKHLVDFLLDNDLDVMGIFAPEHGFRGTADAGEHVSNSMDEKTGLPVFSMYGGNKGGIDKNILDEFDVMVVDIQDVGLRFYTYYITMVKLMDLCAQNDKKMIVLDRPNPNGHYVDGPILDMKHKSGVGWLPIPVVHGMTLGEIALMVNGEGWLPKGRKCSLKVIPCENYTHQTLYELPVPPSPNLPDMKSIYLYPSTCYFEATPVSLGRGTSKPFKIYGHPNMQGYDFSFTPRSIPGAKNPPQLNKKCYGVDISDVPNEKIFENKIDLSYVIDAYSNLNLGNHFFRPFFEKLIGVDYVRKMIIQGKSAGEIEAMWAGDVKKFKDQRRPYLLYEE